MATEDISRNAFSPPKRYAGLRMQQGRVSTDDDYNEGARIEAEETRRVLLDVVGPSGSADDGFLVSNPRINGHGNLDFDIGAGTMYLGGLRLECFGETYTQQVDWLEQLPADRAAPVDGRTDLVYLMAWNQPVEAVEDSELFETALGGPDTTTRIRPMRRVMLATGITDADCAAAWQTELQTLQPIYGTFDPATGLCTPDSKLTVTFDTTGTTDDLCSPSVVGGYLGAENQAIRVQIVDRSHLVWGFDNGSPLYRVSIGADRQTVTVETEPKDQAHWMQSGQVVEILPWSAVLPNGEKLAEITGHLTTVLGAYDPDLKTLTLKDLLPNAPPPQFGAQWQARDDAAALGAPAPYYFMRVWPRGSDTTSPAALHFNPGNFVTLGHTGVRVTLSGSVFVPGDHWVIAARPEDPTHVVPWDLLTGRAPTGIRRYFTPLARITWSVNNANTSGSTVDDCRVPFQPLTRRQNCCTFTVGDGVRSHGNYTVIQDAIDHLPASGGCVCILPGTYAQDVLIDGRRNIRIEGCGERTVIQGASGSQNAAVVCIVDSEAITLTDVTIVNAARIPVQLVDRTEVALLHLPAALSTTPQPKQRTGRRLARIRLEKLTIEARDLSAVVMAGGRFIALLDSDIRIQRLAADLAIGNSTGRWPAVFVAADDVRIEQNAIVARAGAPLLETFRANAGASTGSPVLTLRSRLALGGIQIAGGSERVLILRNLIEGGTGNGITLGSVAYVRRQTWDNFHTNADFAAVAKDWTYVAAGGTLVVDENGCIQYVPFPPPPNGPDGTPLIPVPTGPLTDIRIKCNEIANMGQSGIAAAMFFDIPTNPQAITIEGLAIEDNEITNCLRVELPEITGSRSGWAAYGAIALPEVDGLLVRRNTVADNGRSHLQPICGLFLLAGAAIDITGNTIRDNGPRIESDSVATAGLRGGIFIGFALAPGEDIGTEARPAARVHDNVVVCQDGQALVVVAAVGAVSVSRNALTSRGTSSLVATEATAFAGQGVGGLAVGYTKLGACVVMVDFGVSSELLTTGTFANAKYPYAEAGQPMLPRGMILFNDNQVLLDVMGARGGFIASSVFLLSLDDIAVQDNQIALWAGANVFLTDLLIAAGSLRVTGNRLSETLLRCFLSSLALGILVTASLNQSTHCLLTLSFLGSEARFSGGNVIMIDALAQALKLPAPCPDDYFNRLAL